MKICNACGENKPLNEFSPHPTGLQGVRPNCKPCRRTETRESLRRRRADPDYKDWNQRMVEKYPGIYRSLAAHKNLCSISSMPAYRHYGGRGIEYRFTGSMEEACQLILSRLGPRPEGNTLDRIDVDGHFEIDNLRWATHKQQANNRRIRPTAAEWAAISGAYPEARALLQNLRGTP